jgi:hypothetical protein
LLPTEHEDLPAILRDFFSASVYTMIEAVDGAESVAQGGLGTPRSRAHGRLAAMLDGYDATQQIKAAAWLRSDSIAVSSLAMRAQVPFTLGSCLSRAGRQRTRALEALGEWCCAKAGACIAAISVQGVADFAHP